MTGSSPSYVKLLLFFFFILKVTFTLAYINGINMLCYSVFGWHRVMLLFSNNFCFLSPDQRLIPI